MREISLQQCFDGLRRILSLEVVIDLLPDIGIGAKAATGEQMIALDGIVIFASDIGTFAAIRPISLM